MVKTYFEKKGYTVIRISPKRSSNNAGMPDFEVRKLNNREKFYVEVKEIGSDFSKTQGKRIVFLIKSGNRVLLARVDRYKYVLIFYEIDEFLGHKYLYTVDAPNVAKKQYEFKCDACNYLWNSEEIFPQQCPKCGRKDRHKKIFVPTSNVLKVDASQTEKAFLQKINLLNSIDSTNLISLRQILKTLEKSKKESNSEKEKYQDYNKRMLYKMKISKQCSNRMKKNEENMGRKTTQHIFKKRNPLSKTHKKNISESMKDQHHTALWKRNISKGMKKIWKERKHDIEKLKNLHLT